MSDLALVLGLLWDLFGVVRIGFGLVSSFLRIYLQLISGVFKVYSAKLHNVTM